MNILILAIHCGTLVLFMISIAVYYVFYFNY
jgi:hypothetical protein